MFISKQTVTLISTMGTDLTVTNAARVSFGAQIQQLEPKDHKLIKYLADHKHMCYDDQTEVLTQTGWKLFKDVEPEQDDKVAAITDEGFIQWEIPTHLYQSHYTGKMFKLETTHLNFCVTPNHNMWFSQRHSKGFHPPELIRMDKIATNDGRMFTTAEVQESGTYDDYWNGKLVGFYLGDGFLYSAQQCAFRFKKNRKILAVKEILSELNIEFREQQQAGDVILIKFSCRHIPPYLWDKKAATKYYSGAGFDSKKYLQGLLDGLLQSDGHKHRSAYQYTSISTQLLQDVANVATLLGHSVTFHRDGKSISLKSRSTAPRINDIRLGTKNKPKIIDYHGTIYCATVSTGKLFVRRKGKQLISGNSPFEHCSATFRISTSLPISKQIMRHRTFSYNEISRRYTDKNIEFYVPPHFRKQAVSNRQASEGRLSSLDNEAATSLYARTCRETYKAYRVLIEKGVCKEQARKVLSGALMTEFYLTGNLRNLVHFINLRIDKAAQGEVQEIAVKMRDELLKIYPISMEALMNV